jgi:hypothetical protein
MHHDVPKLTAQVHALQGAELLPGRGPDPVRLYTSQKEAIGRS